MQRTLSLHSIVASTFPLLRFGCYLLIAGVLAMPAAADDEALNQLAQQLVSQSQSTTTTGVSKVAESQINTYTNGSQTEPAVAMNADSLYVVVWQSHYSDGHGSGIQAMYNDRGTFGSSFSTTFQVNYHERDNQLNPAVAMDAEGNFVAVWQNVDSDGSGYSIERRYFDIDDTARWDASSTSISTSATNHAYSQFNPAVAMNASGTYVIVWESNGSDGTDTDGRSIQAQHYNADGTVNIGEFQVNTYTNGDQGEPAVAIDDDGSFVVVWHSGGSSGTDTDHRSIQAQRYNADGTVNGGEFQVNTETHGQQMHPSVAMDADGDFVVVWQSTDGNGADTDGAGIKGQRYDANGTAQGSEFLVNTYTASSQTAPSVAMDADGDFTVAWESRGSDGTDNQHASVQAQRYEADGTASDSQFQVNEAYTRSGQKQAAVAMSADGSHFVIAWRSWGSTGTDNSRHSIQHAQYEVGTITASKTTWAPNQASGAGEMPQHLTLEQNYPNPFNPSTSIRYGVPEAGTVRLAIYDMLGRKVAQLVNGAQEAGWHNVQWHASSDRVSGLYLYRIDMNGASQQGTMMLVK
ncbi:MAG: hypothetical protein RhofKO_43500 [Rhodothermales bacterium]